MERAGATDWLTWCACVEFATHPSATLCLGCASQTRLSILAPPHISTHTHYSQYQGSHAHTPRVLEPYLAVADHDGDDGEAAEDSQLPARAGKVCVPSYDEERLLKTSSFEGTEREREADPPQRAAKGSSASKEGRAGRLGAGMLTL